MQEERKMDETPEESQATLNEEQARPMEQPEAGETGAPETAAALGEDTPRPQTESGGGETAGEQDTEAADEAEDAEKLFEVEFDINSGELYNFQLNMGAAQIEKNKRNSKIVSVIEIGLGVIYLGAIMLGKVPAGMFQVILTVVLLGMGVYGLVYYKYFFYSSLRKSVEKQHKKVPYFNASVRLEIYPNKCVEVFQDKRNPNYWRNILGVMSAPDALYIRLDKQHCMLIPKRCAGTELEPFLRKMCEDFEKEWKEV